MSIRKTKIVCTIGPSCEDRKTIRQMSSSGMDIARFNFSHGDHKWHSKRMDIIKEINKEREFPIATILDLQGPEIRTNVEQGFGVKTGEEVIFVSGVGRGREIGVLQKGFFEGLEKGRKVLIDDGMVEFVVEGVGEGKAVCKALNDGFVGDRKTINVPGTCNNIPALTDKDRSDVSLGIDLGVDYIAMSFVRDMENVKELKDMLEGYDIGVIAKIECASAVENFDKILEVSDAVMIARGDLGVEVAFEKLPLIQREIIRKCNEKGKPVIVATHMLNSMIESPRPTRAEVVDVANAVLGGADAVMLSGETANGKYPVDSVKVMDRVVKEAEAGIKPKLHNNGSNDIGEIVARAVAQVSDSVKASAVLTFTKTGNTAKNIARHRIGSPIFAFTDREDIRKRHSLLWGTYTYLIEDGDINEMIDKGIDILKRSGKVRSGDAVVLTAGMLDGGMRTVAEVRVVG